MPPKQKFTQEEIIAASLNIVRRDGIEGITARGLGMELGSSARPIFTVFQNMEQVHQETIKAAKAIYDTYVQKGLSDMPSFRKVGAQYITFAKEEPKLFQLLFMTEQGSDVKFSDVLSVIDHNSERIFNTIQNEYRLGESNSKRLYQYLWIFTHGIATLYATGVCQFTQAEVDEMFTEACGGIVQRLKRKEEEEV